MISMKEECVGINTANYMAKSKLLYECSEDIWDNIERLSADGEEKKREESLRFKKSTLCWPKTKHCDVMT